MRTVLIMDPQGRYFLGSEPEIVWDQKAPKFHSAFDPTTEKKHSGINHLRKVQSASLVGRSALKVIDFLTAKKDRVA